MAYKAGIVIALLLMVPVVITFIVSMSSGGGLGVFCGINGFYVVGSIIVSCTAPFYTKKNYKKHLGECNSIYFLSSFFVDRMNGGGEFYFMDDTNNFWIVCCIFFRW